MYADTMGEKVSTGLADIMGKYSLGVKGIEDVEELKQAYEDAPDDVSKKQISNFIKLFYGTCLVRICFLSFLFVCKLTSSVSRSSCDRTL